MKTLEINAGRNICAGLPTWDEDEGEPEVVVIQVGRDRVNPDFFEIQRLMFKDPSEDNNTLYIINGDFIHVATITELEAQLDSDFFIFRLNAKEAAEFDGIQEIKIQHQLSEDEVMGIRKTIEFMLRNLKFTLK